MEPLSPRLVALLEPIHSTISTLSNIQVPKTMGKKSWLPSPSCPLPPAVTGPDATIDLDSIPDPHHGLTRKSDKAKVVARTRNHEIDRKADKLGSNGGEITQMNVRICEDGTGKKALENEAIDKLPVTHNEYETMTKAIPHKANVQTLSSDSDNETRKDKERTLKDVEKARAHLAKALEDDEKARRDDALWQDAIRHEKLRREAEWEKIKRDRIRRGSTDIAARSIMVAGSRRLAAGRKAQGGAAEQAGKDAPNGSATDVAAHDSSNHAVDEGGEDGGVSRDGESEMGRREQELVRTGDDVAGGIEPWVVRTGDGVASGPEPESWIVVPEGDEMDWEAF